MTQTTPVRPKSSTPAPSKKSAEAEAIDKQDKLVRCLDIRTLPADVTDALIRAHKRNVKVHITFLMESDPQVSQKKQLADIRKLLKAGVPVELSFPADDAAAAKRSAALHHEFGGELVRLTVANLGPRPEHLKTMVFDGAPLISHEKSIVIDSIISERSNAGPKLPKR